MISEVFPRLGWAAVLGFCVPAAAAEKAPGPAPAPASVAAAASPAAVASPAAAASPAPSPADDEGPGEADDVPEAPPSDDAAPPAARSRGASREGATGVDTVLSADPGARGAFRLRLSLFGFSADDFPTPGSSDSFTGTTLAFAYTPVSLIETYLALRNTSNSNDGTHPSLLQTQGDLTLGVKGGGFLTPSIGLGLAAQAQFLGGMGGGFSGDGTSLWLRALFTADATRSGKAPIRFLADFGYYFENAEKVATGEPNDLDKIQEFGLQVARYDRLTAGFAIESPLSPYFDPFLEYRIDVPLQVELTRRADLRDDFTFGAVPHSLAPGLRIFPLPELSLDAEVRIGLSSESYLGVPATPPWLALFAVAYSLERQPPPPPPEPPKIAAPPPPPEGTVAGRVLTAAGEALADARVEYLGAANFTAQVADNAGRFTSYRLPPGKVRLRVRAAKMLPKEVEATVEAGKSLPLEVRLEPDPAQLKGAMTIQVVDMAGKGLAASIIVGTEPETTGEVTADTPWKAEVKPGTWPVTARAAGYRPRTMDAELKGGETGNLRIALEKGTAGGSKGTRNVVVRARVIELRRKVHFADGQARLLPDSEPLLEEVAQVLQAHPEIKKVRIEGHTDNRGDRALNMRLSEDRAKSVQYFLATHGVAASRLTSKGYGPDKPVAPNLTERGREKNRRVELVIVEQDK